MKRKLARSKSTRPRLQGHFDKLAVSVLVVEFFNAVTLLLEQLQNFDY